MQSWGVSGICSAQSSGPCTAWASCYQSPALTLSQPSSGCWWLAVSKIKAFIAVTQKEFAAIPRLALVHVSALELAAPQPWSDAQLSAGLPQVGRHVGTDVSEGRTSHPCNSSIFVPDRLCFTALTSFPSSGPFSNMTRPNGSLLFKLDWNHPAFSKDDLQMVTILCDRLSRLFILLLLLLSTPFSKENTFIALRQGWGKQTKPTTKLKTR